MARSDNDPETYADVRLRPGLDVRLRPGLDVRLLPGQPRLDLVAALSCLVGGVVDRRLAQLIPPEIHWSGNTLGLV